MTSPSNSSGGNRTSSTPRHGAAKHAWREIDGGGLRGLGVAFAWAWVVAMPVLGLGWWKIYQTWRVAEDARLLAIHNAQAYERLVAAPPAGALLKDAAAHGRDLFMSACVACHGAAGTGVTGLGKNLVESDFVALQSDDQMREFIAKGRPDAQPIPMPPRAGRDDLTDDDLAHIVVYLRGLQDPRRMPELPAMAAVSPAAPSEADKAAALAAAGGDAELAGYIASGNKIFHSLCVSCHGKGGVGMTGNGKPLVRNEFVKSLDDDALLAFVKQGRAPSDPKNTTGIQMPPKGGNPAMSDDDILDVIAYLRTLQGEKPSAAAGG